MADFPLGGYVFTEEAGADESASKGTVVTSGSSAKGSWVELVASTTDTTALFILSVEYAATGATIRDFLIDVGIGAASSEEVIVSDLQIQMKQTFSPVNHYYLPIRIPSGTRIAVRIESNSSSDSINVNAHLFAPTFQSNPGYSKTTAYGVSGTDGTDIDPGGTANTKGSWVELTASTSDAIEAFNICIGSNTNNAHNDIDYLYDLAIGGSGSEEIILENMHVVSSNFEVSKAPVCVQHKIASGSRLAMRMQCSSTDATDRVLSFSINGIS